MAPVMLPPGSRMRVKSIVCCFKKDLEEVEDGIKGKLNALELAVVYI
jgi:hypothetical protein